MAWVYALPDLARQSCTSLVQVTMHFLNSMAVTVDNDIHDASRSSSITSNQHWNGPNSTEGSLLKTASRVALSFNCMG
jgi:hypothetical protein